MIDIGNGARSLHQGNLFHHGIFFMAATSILSAANASKISLSGDYQPVIKKTGIHGLSGDILVAKIICIDKHCLSN
jgi:hypothetical protein